MCGYFYGFIGLQLMRRKFHSMQIDMSIYVKAGAVMTGLRRKEE